MELWENHKDNFSIIWSKSLNYWCVIQLARKIINCFDQFLVVPPFLKWELESSLEDPSRMPLCCKAKWCNHQSYWGVWVVVPYMILASNSFWWLLQSVLQSSIYSPMLIYMYISLIFMSFWRIYKRWGHAINIISWILSITIILF